MKSIHNHDKDMRQVRDAHSLEEYTRKRQRIEKSLTTSAVQFKKERIEKKVDRMKAGYSKVNLPNRFERREGYTLTPLMQGKIQYGKMRKKENMDAVREELRMRSVDFESDTGWKEMIKLLKANEKNINANAHDKYFSPLTDYAKFHWNDDN